MNHVKIINKKLSALLLVISLIVSCMSVSMVSADGISVDTMKNLINTKYSQNSWLGQKVTGYCLLANGMYVAYANGSIYIGKNVGRACILGGEISKKWANQRWERGPLGYPTTDELTASYSPLGKYQHFEGGTIYWSHGTGAIIVEGTIDAAYQNLSRERGALGFVKYDAAAAADGGKVQHFEKGSIFLSTKYGAVASYGSINYKYWSLGFEKGILGYPKFGIWNTKHGGQCQHFENGSIYYDKNCNAKFDGLHNPDAHVLYGPINEKFLEIGGTDWGTPVSDVYTTKQYPYGEVEMAVFHNFETNLPSFITWYKYNNTVDVYNRTE